MIDEYVTENYQIEGWFIENSKAQISSTTGMTPLTLASRASLVQQHRQLLQESGCCVLARKVPV